MIFILEVIKSYLVALGFQVNNSEFDKANKAISDLGDTVQSVTTGMTKNFAGAATAVAGAVTAITGATAGLIVQVTKADMEYQKLALHMYTTKQTAKDLKNVLDTMGESLDDIAWIPELREQYFALMQQAQQLSTPADADNQLKYVRSIMFEFQRLKLEATYAIQWIGYYLIKYLSGPLGDLKGSLKGLNDWIIDNMPVWTNKVAKWLTMIINLGKSGVKFIVDLYSALKGILDMLPRGVKSFMAAITVLGAFMLASPFGQFIFILSSALILLEDFYGYVEGRKSSKTLAPIWEKLLGWFKDIKSFGQDFIPQIGQYLDGLIGKVNTLGKESLKAVYNNLSSIFTILTKELDKNGVLPALRDMLSDVGEALDDIALGITNIMKQMGLMPQRSAPFKGFWHWFGEELSQEIKRLASVGKFLAGIMDMIGLAMQGEYKRAAQKGMSLFPQFIKDLTRSGQTGGSTRTWENNGKGADNAQMAELSQQVSAKTGLPAQWIYGQWYHESGGFSSDLAKENNNFGGLKTNNPRPGIDPAAPDGGYYRHFDSPQEYADYFAKYIKLYGEDGIFNANTVEDYAHALKSGGYYGDSEENYALGIRNGMNSYIGSDNSNLYNTAQGYNNAMASTYTADNTSNNSVNINGDINIAVPPNSNPEQYYSAVIQAMNDKFGIKTAMETREVSGVFA